MEYTNLYDVMKNDSKKTLKIYKNRKKVINKRISEYDNKYLYITSFLMILGGLSTIGMAEISKYVMPNTSLQKLAGISLILLAPVVAYYGKDKTHQEQIKELKQQREVINTLIKSEKKEVKQKKDKLEKILIMHK